MSFGEQTRWCIIWGLALIPVVLLLLGTAALMPSHLTHMLDVLALIVVIQFSIMIVIGGIFRPLTKSIYHRLFEALPFARWNASLPILRHWFWLNSAGRDRDA